MSLQHVLDHNRTFVESRGYEGLKATRYPDKQMVVVTCMDTRLVELLPQAMGLRNGDAKIVKTAGAVISHPFGSIMRSIMVAIYELGAKEVFVVGHHDCGMTTVSPARIMNEARQRGVKPEVLDTLKHAGIHMESWLAGFRDVRESVQGSVGIVRHHPLLPADIKVYGMIMDPETGALEMVERA